MRNKTMRRSLSTARLMMLALCFVMVFTMAFVLLGEAGLNADAADKVRVYAGDTYSGSNVQPDNYGLSAYTTGLESLMGYATDPTVDKDGVKTWSVGNITFNDWVFSTNSFTYSSEESKIKSVSVSQQAVDASTATIINAPLDGNDSLVFVFNISLPTYLQNLLSGNEEFEMTFDAQVDVLRGQNGTTNWKRAMAKIGTSSEPISANNTNHNSITGANKGGKTRHDSYGYEWNETEKGEDKKWASSAWSGSTLNFSSLKLNKSTPNIYVCIGIGDKSGCNVAFKDLKLTNVKITKKTVADSATVSRVDGAAPVVLSQYDSTKTDSFYPYRTDANTAGTGDNAWSVWHSNITSKLSTAVDNVTNGRGALKSYTNTSKTYGEGKTYYKSSSITYQDAYNYLSGNMYELDTFTSDKTDVTPTTVSLKLAQDIDRNYASGIKRVIVGDQYKDMDADKPVEAAVFNLYEMTAGVGLEKDIYVDGEVVGWAVVTKTDRAEVVVETYMYKNAAVITKVTDYGESSNTWSITYSGIDTTDPNAGTLIDNDTFVGTQAAVEKVVDGTTTIDLSSIDWFRESTFTADAECTYQEGQEAEDDSDPGYSPYIWFYTVDKADNYNGFNARRTFSSYNDVKNAAINPIACGDEISSFVYDFSTGYAKAVGNVLQGVPGTDKSGKNVSVAGPTGAGYYRFNFYVFDLAGNKGGVNSFYVKVDYDKPTYTIDFKYGDGNTITSKTNGKWATDDIEITLALSNGGFSGYTLTFEANDEMHALVIDGYGETSRTGIGTRDEFVSALTGYVNGSGVLTNISDNTITVENLATSVGNRNVEISYSHTYKKDASGNYITGSNGEYEQEKVFKFVIKKETGKNFAWITPFGANCGQYTDIMDISDLEGYINKDWGSVNILLDSTAPSAPEMSDSGDLDQVYLKALGGYDTLPTDRVWYTDTLKKYSIGIDFFDDIVKSDDYASDLTVYYAFKHVSSLEELVALGEKDIKNKIKNLSSAELEEGKYFTNLIAQSGTEFYDSETLSTFEVDLISGNSAGMRVFYVWAEDQAGNKSDVNTYYVLADPTPYSVAASVNRDNNLDKDSANISFTNASGEAVSAFKRGEEVILTIGIEKGYVPFSLKMNGTLLLENYTPNNVWTTVWSTTDKDGNVIVSPYISTSDYGSSKTVKYTLDDADDISQLKSQHKFELAHRQVVKYTITSNKVNYTSAPTDVFAQTYFDNYDSKTHFQSKFLDASDVELASAPIECGTYKVAMFIDKNDAKYVTEDFAMDASGSQAFNYVSYTIIPGTVIITATPTTSVYGEDPSKALEFTVSGIDESKLGAEGIAVDLALRGEADANGKWIVGSYQIVCTSNWSKVKNYDVEFESAIHIIAQREVNVYAWAESKEYKQADPALRFGVKLADFDEDTQAEIFKGYRRIDGEESGYILYYADGKLSRASGETVGKYKYNNTESMFDVNSNYRVVLQTNNDFEITQRVVTLDVSGQSSVFAFGEKDAIDVSSIIPSYKLSKADLALADEIAALNIKLSLDAGSASALEKGEYDSATGYTIKLSADTSSNIALKIDDNPDNIRYIVYVTDESTIIVRAKAGATFSGIYGLVSGQSFTLPYSADKFEIVGTPSADVTNITWSASISSADGLLDAGEYVVTFSDAKLVGNDGELADKVVVEQVMYTVNQAKIVVKPTVQNLAKTYGEEDSVYGIGFEIVSIAGFTPEEVAAALSIDVNTLKSVVSGAYARAIFKDSGKRDGYATRYDNATQNGIIAGTNNSYYGIAIGTEFASNNANFIVEATLDNSIRLAINAKEIVLETKDFVGISKYYDGTTDAFYGTTAMFNIANYLVRAQDDVTLSADAAYSAIGSPNKNEKVYITFSNITLKGTDARNYAIVGIVNNGKDAVLENYNDAVSEKTAVKIVHIDNENGTDTDVILIKQGYIDVVKSDIVVSKQYDNTTGITAADISFKNGDGTRLLANNKNMIVLSGSLSGVNVGSNYFISTLKIFFPFGSDIDIKNDPITQSEKYQDVAVYNYTYTYQVAGEMQSLNGVVVEISTVGAKITQRVINADSFSSITAVDREYNATTYVDIDYVLEGGAIAEGDTEKTVGLLLGGKANDKNAGRSNVTLSTWSVLDDNYTVDLASVQSRFNAIYVDISKAALIPVVEFGSKVYDGKSDISPTTGSLTGKFTTTWATNLKDELELISFVATDVDFVLSLNGKENANVQTKMVDGKATYPHNVMISGMNISFDASLTDAQKADIVKNYKLAGSIYNSANGEYMEITGLTEGAVSDYELLDFITVEPKQIVLTNNDFKIADKIYDGSIKADITVPISEDRLVDPSHADMLEVTASGEFTDRDVRDGITVTIFKESIELKAKNEEGIAIFSNYVLVLSYDAEIKGNIKPRPVVLSVDFGEQVYNGNELVKDSGIDYDIDGIIGREICDVYTENGAYYDNKDVEYSVTTDEGGNTVKAVTAKNGTAYGVRLDNAKNNYKAVYASSTLLEGKTFVAYVTADNDWVFASSVNKGDTVQYYCYDLETTQNYVWVSGVNYTAAKDANAIIGTYLVGDQKVYMLASDYTGAVDGSLASAITYLRGTGTVTQREVTLSSDGIISNEADGEFKKYYDGTKKFYGSYTVDVTKALYGVIKGDDVSVKDVSAEYESENCGQPKVVFRISEIEGSDEGNYKISGNSALEVRKDGRILPISITAKLADGIREYGDTSVPNAISYSIVNGEEEYALYVGGTNKLYMSYAHFVALTGLVSDTDGYVETLDARRYNLVDGGYVKAEDGEYILLGGNNDTIASLPSAKAKVNAILSAGSTTTCTLTDGKATNYKFVPQYTGTDGSELRIVKKQLYVFTETRDFAKTYGSSNPDVTLIYKDKNGADGIISRDQWTTLFKIGSKDYRPVVKLGVFKDGTITPLTSLEKISEHIDGQYVFYLDASDFADVYEQIENYEVHVAGYGDVYLNSDGKAAFKIDGYQQTHVASTLTITLPKVDGITVGSNEENVFTYKKGVNWINEVLRGELATDVVTFEIDGKNVEAIDAGIYEGTIHLKRYINANGDFVSESNADANGYYVVWDSGDTKVKITVNKQTINIWTSGASVYYDGKDQSYTGTINHTAIEDDTDVTALKAGTDYTISYERYDSAKKEYVSTTSVVNAGRYRIIVKFVDTNADGVSDFEDAHPNLTAGKEIKADFTVIRAQVQISDITLNGVEGSDEMLEDERITKLTALYSADANYNIQYNVDGALGEDKLTLVLKKNGAEIELDNINEAGKYTFTIVIDDEDLDESNYAINGGKGVLELTVSHLEDSNGNALDLGENTITANRLVVTEIGNGTTSANDMRYLNIVEQHVAALSAQAGYETAARVVALYRVSLYCDDKVVTPNGNITVSVAMPDELDSLDGIVIYTVTEEGGLQKLTDYKVENGKVVYTTDHVSGIVFVDTNAEGLAPWIIYTIVAVVAFVVLVVVATVVAIVVRKARLKKLD